MHDPPEAQRRPLRRAATLLACTAALLAMYALSIGPAARLALLASSRPGPDDDRPRQVFHVVYWPVVQTVSTAGWEDALIGYIRWWLPR